MSQHSDEVRFRHMLDHAMEALTMVQEKIDRIWTTTGC